MTVSLSPIFNIPFVQDSDGVPLDGGKIFAYEAGSNSVLLDTFTTSAGDVANSNPIILDSSGNLPAAIWLTDAQAYNLVLTDSSGTTVLKGFDNVTGVPIPTSGTSGSTAIWVSTTGGTYLTPTQFLVTGNLTIEFAVGNRVRVTQAGSFTYGVVSAVSFSDPNTLVTIVNDGAVLNSSLTLAEYSVLAASPRETVDAGGVSFFDSLTYATNTVGWKINTVYTTLAAADSALNTRVSSTYNAQSTSGTNNYTASADSLITTYSTGQKFTLKFTNAASGACTVNINSIGAKSLYQYTSAGAKINPTITAGMMSQISYDGTDFILLDQLPAATAGAAPRGSQVITSNAVFTVPTGVTTIKVSVWGAGGGGGGGAQTGDVETGYSGVVGGSGGTGGNAVKYLTVSPGGTYSVSIGAPGAGSVSNGSAGGSNTFGASLVVATGGGGGAFGGGGSSGPNGTVSVGDWGTFAVGMISSGVRALGGVGGADIGLSGATGSPGLCIVEW